MGIQISEVLDKTCTFEEVGLVGSWRVHSSIQVSREFPPQPIDPYWCVVSQVRDGPHVITAESKGFPPWTWSNIQRVWCYVMSGYNAHRLSFSDISLTIVIYNLPNMIASSVAVQGLGMLSLLGLLSVGNRPSGGDVLANVLVMRLPVKQRCSKF